MPTPYEDDPALAVTDAVGRTLRVAAITAAHLTQRIARAREQAASAAEAGHRQQARELHARLGAEAALARASVHAVRDDRYFDTASPEDIARAYGTAHAWSVHDPELRAVADRIREQVSTRYGIDVEDLNLTDLTDPTGVGGQRDVGQDVGGGVVESVSAGVGQDVADDVVLSHPGTGPALISPAVSLAASPVPTSPRAVSTQVDVVRQGWAYDTPERRQALRASLEGAMSPAALDARMTADVGSSRPAGAAVATRLGPGEATDAGPDRLAESLTRTLGRERAGG